MTCAKFQHRCAHPFESPNRFFAYAAELYASEAHEQQGLGLHYTLRQPLGPVALEFADLFIEH